MQTGNCIATLQGHNGPIFALAISPDGTKVVTGSYDHTAKIWDMQTHNCIATLQGLRGHNRSIWALAISPDGTKVVTGSRDNTAKIWDIGNLFGDLKKLTIKQIRLLDVIREFAGRHHKLDLTKETNITAKYAEQYALLPDLIESLVAEYVKVD